MRTKLSMQQKKNDASISLQHKIFLQDMPEYNLLNEIKEILKTFQHKIKTPLYKKNTIVLPSFIVFHYNAKTY